jgi:PelA/Pel-15E family pectate lyase
MHMLKSAKLMFFNTLLILTFMYNPMVSAQSGNLTDEARQTMLEATKFMVEEVSTNGGYLWGYLPDMSRRWGEMEAYDTMIWVQPPGTVSMAHTFLDAYQITGDEYYYMAAEKAVQALIWGQSEHGGWNYFIDFAGDRSMKQWYETIGYSGWRLEEFDNYYGNSTYDDDVISDAARVILRMYLERLDPKFKPALDKAIDFIIESQYPNGGWPQRYPLVKGTAKEGLDDREGNMEPIMFEDYTAHVTFNDDVQWENINFLIQSYLTLGQERLLDPIRRAMDVYLKTLQGSPQVGWGMQHYADNLKPAAARSHEPKGFAPSYTYNNTLHLIQFYKWTGDSKYIARIPDIIDWLERTAYPEPVAYRGGTATHPRFVEIGTNRPVYVTRRGSNQKYGRYVLTYDDSQLLGHYGMRSNLDIDRLKREYESVLEIPVEELTKNSPILTGKFEGDGTGVTPQHFYDLNRTSFDTVPDAARVRGIINALDEQNRWLVTNMNTSNPYIGEGQNQELTDEYSTTHVGDEYDTSPYRDESDQQYISMREYIQNMNLLMNFVAEQSNR